MGFCRINGCRTVRLIVLLAVASMAMAACGDRFTDVRPPDSERIVSFAPHITETLYALGVGDRVVAVTTYCDYPPEVEELETVGDYMNPSLEKLTRLNPGAIIVQGEHGKVTEYATHNAIPLYRVDMDTIDTIRDGIYIIGEAVERKTEAEALWSDIESELDAIRNAVAHRSPKSVLLITARHTHDLNNLYTIGARSFLTELAELAGGENIYGDVDQAYISGSKETVVMRAPEVIIEFHAGESLSDEAKARFISDWDQLGSLPAVQNDRVHIVMESHALRPGPRITDIARIMAQAIHPDVELPDQ